MYTISLIIEFWVLIFINQDPHHPDLARAVVNMTNCVTRCKFQTTDVVSDEIVLANILKLLRTMVQSEIGKKCISDKGICEMVEVAFRMHLQSRISELLKKSAEDTLLVLTQCMFERLVVITRESEHREAMKGRLKSTRPIRPSSFALAADTGIDEVIRDTAELPNLSPKKTVKPGLKLKNAKPFGIPAILEFTRVLITLIDPKDHRHTDTLHRALGLKLAARGLEVGGQSLAKWVRAGFVIEKEMEKATPKERIELDGLNSNMTIVTEQPATVVSVGGADGTENYSELNSPKLGKVVSDVQISSFANSLVNDVVEGKSVVEDEKARLQEAAKNVDIPKEASLSNTKDIPVAQKPIKNVSSSPGIVDDIERDDLQETDFQKLAMNIKHMIVDDMTRHLFQLLLTQNTTNMAPPSWSGLNTISLVLRTISILFSTMKEHLIPQQQWFIQHLMKSCESGVSAWDIDEWAKSVTGKSLKSGEEIDNISENIMRPPEPVLVSEVRELYFETLLQICRSDTTYTEMYIFHDTNISDKTHVLEDLLKFFSKVFYSLILVFVSRHRPGRFSNDHCPPKLGI